MNMVDKIRSVATLLTGSPASPYASASSMRSLDGLIRARLSDNLSQGAARLREHYAQVHQDLAHLSREHPMPSAEDMEHLRQIKRVGEQLSALAALAAALPAPAGDHVWRTLRNNQDLLALLIEYDYSLVQYSATLETLTNDPNGLSMAAFNAPLESIRSLMRQRADLLSAVP